MLHKNGYFIEKYKKIGVADHRGDTATECLTVC